MVRYFCKYSFSEVLFFCFIRFKEESTPEPTKREKERATYEKLGLLPFYGLFERHGVADKAIKAVARS